MSEDYESHDAQTKPRRESGKRPESVVAAIESSLVTFKDENPDIVAELTLLGFEMDEYESVLASSGPQILTTTNSTLSNDME